MTNHDELLRKREAREEGRDPYAAEVAPDEIEARLVEIRQRAEHVQSAHVGKVEAIMSERKHASEILAQAIAYVTPAIEALEGKIETYNEKTTVLRAGEGGGISSNQVQQFHYSMKGVLLVDRFAAIQGGERDLTGKYGGVGLYLLHDGSLMLGKRSGAWSRRLGAMSEFNLDLQPCTTLEALRLFRIEEILSGFISLLESQGALAAQARAVRQRAARLATALVAITDFLAEE